MIPLLQRATRQGSRAWEHPLGCPCPHGAVDGGLNLNPGMGHSVGKAHVSMPVHECESFRRCAKVTEPSTRHT